ncbi:MAG: hypothetical protein FJ218_01805 [Ignavibacteria bacterium]|nr:hypothetical protein [Ignavibacteria bacterium]
MFPISQHKNASELITLSHYNDDVIIPPYEEITLPPDASPQKIAREIYSTSNGTDISGYIANDTVYFHKSEEVDYGSNTSKWFSFATYNLPSEPTRLVPSSLAVLVFLVNNAHQVMFIANNYAIHLEKTVETYEICRELNKIYESEEFLEYLESTKPQVVDCFGEDAEEEIDSESILPGLLCQYIFDKNGGEEDVYVDFEEDYMQLLKETLKLNVEVFLLE